MKTTKLKPFYKELIIHDMVLCGKLCQALKKSLAHVCYRIIPEDDERLTLPRIQNVIREHLNLAPEVELIEEVDDLPIKEMAKRLKVKQPTAKRPAAIGKSTARGKLTTNT